VAGTSQSERLLVSHPVFHPALASGQNYGLIHLLLVALQKREVISKHQEFGEFQLALGGSLKSALGFLKAIQEWQGPLTTPPHR
jgi:hypothetical protein